MQTANTERIFIDYDLGHYETGLAAIASRELRYRAYLVSGMISLDRDLCRRLKSEKIRALPKEYFYAEDGWA
jgi:hypothetical protein